MSDRLTDVLELYAYDDWASERVLEAASVLTQEQLTRDLGGSFPSVLATLCHIVASNWVWLSRWHGASPGGWPAEWRVDSIADLAFHDRTVRRERADLLAGLTGSDLERVVDYRNTRGEPLTSTMHEMLRHVVNHASYHRGQVTHMLRLLGATPVATDMIRWYRERPQAVATERADA